MKLYELITQHINQNCEEYNFVHTTHYTDKYDAMQEFLNTRDHEIQDIADIEEDMHDSACNADELNARVTQYHYFSEDEKYMRVCCDICDALDEDNIIAYYACYKNEYREDSTSVRIILKEVELH